MKVKMLAFLTPFFLLFSFFLSSTFYIYAQEPIRIKIEKPPQILPGENITPGQIVNFILTLLAVIGVLAALVFLIYGGIKWIVSGGDKAAVEAARGQIVNSIIGLVVIILAFVIVSFIIQLLGANRDSIFSPTITPLSEQNSSQTSTPITAATCNQRHPNFSIPDPANNRCCQIAGQPSSCTPF